MADAGCTVGYPRGLGRQKEGKKRYGLCTKDGDDGSPLISGCLPWRAFERNAGERERDDNAQDD
jgi:hypothetical protein